MGTVLSFSPRERRPIYSSTTHHHGSGNMSTSNSTSDFQLNSYAYEQINNAKNRENCKPMQYLSVPNQFQLQGNGSQSASVVLFNAANGSSSNGQAADERQADSARILSEKNAIEKNLKKHSLFINALSWKRLSSSHGKKKLEANGGKGKPSSGSNGTFRPPTLTDTVHPMVVVNDKKKYPQQQVQLIATNGNHTQNANYFGPNGGDHHHKNLLALDLQNANIHHNIERVAPKMSIPVRPVQFSAPAGGEQASHAAPRKTIIQDYEVHQVLGKGGFATVYKARCRLRNREVAIKMIDKNLMQAYNMTERVRQEVGIHARLKHPSILELYTFFEDNNFVYLVLELAHNGTLQKFLSERQKTLSEPEAARVVSQVVNGLLYLQSNSIMHRDISMSNLLLTLAMQVKISDFGLATQINHHLENKHTTLCGTPNYISPEVASRSAHGLKTDNWSLGCLLYTLLVGRPPFDTNGVKSTLTQVVMGNYSIPAHISAEAQDLIKQLLCKDQAKRIDLHAVVAHPFMRAANRTTIDSGIATFSKSLDTLSTHQSDFQVVGSASVFRSQRQLSVHSQVQQQGLGVQPLNTTRLQPTRHQMRSVILSIEGEPSREVVIESLKYKPKYEENRVVEVCRISSDGLRIVVYQPNRGKGVRVEDSPPAMPSDGADHIYSYDSLPEKHFKKYLYAHRFVQMVRAKTPKVTFYSELAKCQLMESLEDFEMFLYGGGSVRKTKSEEFQVTGECDNTVLQHAEKCYQHCTKIEQILSLTSLDSPCFPVIIGRRPDDKNEIKEALQERPQQNTFNNYISSSQTPLRTPKINMPSFSLEQTPSPLSVKASSIGSASNYRLQLETPPTTPQFQSHTKTSANIPGIGHAALLLDGTLEINYTDGSKIVVLAQQQGGGIVFSSTSGSRIKYSENDLMPDVVRSKVNQLPTVLGYLKPRDIAFVTSTPVQPDYNPVFHSNRLNHMKFIR